MGTDRRTISANMSGFEHKAKEMLHFPKGGARRRSTTRPSIRSHTLMTLPMSAHPPSLNKPIRLMLAHLPSLETPILPTSELALSSQNCKPINERKHGCYPCEEVSVSSRIPSVIKDVVMHRHRVYISNIVLESGLLRMNWN